MVPGTSDAGALPGTGRTRTDGLLHVLTRDGRPLAFADSHGTRLQWMA